jgi:succinate-acetate transporter protein
VALLAVAVMGTSSGMYRAGGVFVLIFAAFGYYAYLSGAVESVGGKSLPLGQPVVSWFSK